MPTVLKSGILILLEPSGPVQACNGIAVPLLFWDVMLTCHKNEGVNIKIYYKYGTLTNRPGGVSFINAKSNQTHVREWAGLSTVIHGIPGVRIPTRLSRGSVSYRLESSHERL